MTAKLPDLLARLPQHGIEFHYTNKSSKEFEKLDSSVATLFRKLFEKIASKDPRIDWRHLGPKQAEYFQTSNLWSARANHKYRLFVERHGKVVVVLGFDHRGSHNYKTE